MSSFVAYLTNHNRRSVIASGRSVLSFCAARMGVNVASRTLSLLFWSIVVAFVRTLYFLSSVGLGAVVRWVFYHSWASSAEG